MNTKTATTTELLLEFIALAPAWRATLRARVLAPDPITPRPGSRPVRMLFTGGSLVEVQEPTAEEEDHWNALTAEINKRIPGGAG